MSDERLDIIAREADGPNPPGLLGELRASIEELFPIGTEAAGNWFKGKGAAEVAKAQEIRARAMAALGELQIEREKLIAERDTIREAEQTKQYEMHLAHEQRMLELRTIAFKEMVASARELKDLGINVVPHIEKALKVLTTAQRTPKPPSAELNDES